MTSLMSQIREIVPEPIKKRRKYMLGVLSTEFNFRFKRKETREHLEKIRRIPRGLHLEGTNVCNAKCVFCAYPQMQRRKSVMSFEDFCDVIEQYVEMGGHYVSLSPLVGDPFVDPKLFEKLDYLYKHKSIKGFYFFTNAILMKPDVSKQLLDYADKLVVNVSWGGFDRETYKTSMGVDKFDVALENVEALVEYKRQSVSPHKLRFVIHLRCPESCFRGEVWERFRKYEQEGLIDKSEITQGFDSWAGKISPEDLINAGLQPKEAPYKRGACELLFSKPMILVNGEVNACGCRDVEAELVVGNLKEEKLSDIWAGEAIDKIIDQHERGDFPDVCQRCTYYTSVYNRRKTMIFDTTFNWMED